MTTEQFDPHVLIRELAEAEWKCPCHECHGNPVVDTWFCRGQQLCCSGTGRIVPFAVLRLGQQEVRGLTWSHLSCPSEGKCEWASYFPAILSGAEDCNGRGWVPEPDVEKACWRIGKVLQGLAEGVLYWIAVARLKAAEKDSMWEMEECWLRAAEAWLNEKKETS